jgi:hypothetical protein
MKKKENLIWKNIEAMQAKTDQQMKKTAESIEELSRLSKESDQRLKELGRNIGGISHSNGEMAEEYFYNAFNADKTFANEKFDEIEKNLAFKNKEKKAEFDLVLFNGKSAALIEVKYNAKPDNISVNKIISRIEIFKTLVPECKNHNIYLGVAAMSFKEGLEKELHQAGIATIKQVGNKMVVCDKDIKVF